jgi:hypothetical protein
MYFETSSSIQLLPKNLGELFVDHGWNYFGRYRAWSQLGSDPYRKRFADVRLFESVGSDGQSRYFGFIHGYGVTTPTPIGEEPIITHSSELGKFGHGDGIETKFQSLVYPIVPGSLTVYFNGVAQPDSIIASVEKETGLITLTSAPADGVEVSGTYALTDNAPNMPARLYFFTCDTVRPERLIVPNTTPEMPESKLGTGSGGTTTFDINSPGHEVKPDSVTVFVDGAIVSNYTVDYVTKRVTFDTAPATGSDIEISFVQKLTKDSNGYFGDFQVGTFNPTDKEGLAGAAYSVLNLIIPSIPTALSFIPAETYSGAWFRDTQIYLWGNATKDRIMLFTHPDPAPDPTKVYISPLYIGRLSTIGKEPRRNNVIIAGHRTTDAIPYATDKKLSRYKVDYGANTSNGNEGVLLQQSVGGSYYQKYYLSFITHDVMMEESSESKFNPSVYTGKYHISPIYVVHPNDGYVGRLDEVYAIHPKNISQMDELEVTENSKDEVLGVGDGIKTVFHFYHKPVNLQIQVDCGVITTGFTIDPEAKTITFDTPPGPGAEVVANYEYNQVYKYTLPDAPSVFNDEKYSPYQPIGLGVLKQNL